jgi:hypothetical protein
MSLLLIILRNGPAGEIAIAFIATVFCLQQVFARCFIAVVSRHNSDTQLLSYGGVSPQIRSPSAIHSRCPLEPGINRAITGHCPISHLPSPTKHGSAQNEKTKAGRSSTWIN